MASPDDPGLVESHVSSAQSQRNRVHHHEIELEGGIDKPPTTAGAPAPETPAKNKEGEVFPGPHSDAKADDYTTGKKLIPESMLGSPSKKLEAGDIETLKREIEIKKQELSAMGALAEVSDF